MAVQISYDANNRLQLTGIECDCGSEHNLPDQDIYVGTDLIGQIPAYLARQNLGQSCVLVADDNTWPLVGEKIVQLLTDNNYTVNTCLIRRAGEMEPDERACGEVLLSIQPETRFLISVGSGSITDITRLVAVRTGLPFVCVGTAASMDGYTSVVAPLLLRGTKIHRAAVCPCIIVCDLDILKTAPLEMVVAGVGDVLGKYIARTDWQLGQIINDEIYCPVCADMVTAAVARLLENLALIKSRSRAGMRILIEALLLAGVTIMIIGHTRAVASIEHNIVHLWDMQMLAQGKKQPPHGTAVGLATYLVWPIFERFAQEDLASLDLDQIKAGRPSHAQRRRWLLASYGLEAATDIMRENPQDFLDWPEQARRIKRAQSRFSQIKAVLETLPPLAEIEKALLELGAPLDPAQLGISQVDLNVSLHAGKDYRSRYSLFKLLDECGLLEEYLADYPLKTKE